MKFVIGSASKRKIEVAEKIIRQLVGGGNLFITGYPSYSGVPDTPYDKQTFDGANNRARDAKAHIKDGDIFIGLESGLVERHGHIYEEAWCAILDKDEKSFYGYSSGLKVPDLILKKMDELKLEHCDVMAMIEEEDGKMPSETWGNYSGGMIAREISLEESLRNALIQIFSPDHSLYNK
ncbi:MAG TPA: inosine/xanthosine triphosphatase [Candidatus Paceibacterota bacterium]|nr:inosine/xanthosine triphosphatase [Candidatus Paceibacterota bacterium]